MFSSSCSPSSRTLALIIFQSPKSVTGVGVMVWVRVGVDVGVVVGVIVAVAVGVEVMVLVGVIVIGVDDGAGVEVESASKPVHAMVNNRIINNRSFFMDQVLNKQASQN